MIVNKTDLYISSKEDWFRLCKKAKYNYDKSNTPFEVIDRSNISYWGVRLLFMPQDISYPQAITCGHIIDTVFLTSTYSLEVLLDMRHSHVLCQSFKVEEFDFDTYFNI